MDVVVIKGKGMGKEEFSSSLKFPLHFKAKPKGVSALFFAVYKSVILKGLEAESHSQLPYFACQND